MSDLWLCRGETMPISFSEGGCLRTTGEQAELLNRQSYGVQTLQATHAICGTPRRISKRVLPQQLWQSRYMYTMIGDVQLLQSLLSYVVLVPSHSFKLHTTLAYIAGQFSLFVLLPFMFSLLSQEELSYVTSLTPPPPNHLSLLDTGALVKPFTPFGTLGPTVTPHPWLRLLPAILLKADNYWVARDCVRGPAASARTSDIQGNCQVLAFPGCLVAACLR
ncbi:hypothetical protein FFLO_06123 [Filobasidium floriforme]|uniref:Uncharacterized protein n=1 Tax=Filobasidium floriforme TaxID=5210 RepID=A0A8K0JFY7_9TREE|nr:uncharacterized protein HD553DRAFT_322438 [Filobasidium floriforme]KAG7528469.1 hypothetical protein FFLO_06123 [Filobasidium floriforme]KAH8088600.1 hypothetical protein HD553DRAFT_322438 [Filobasidium floriforme]